MTDLINLLRSKGGEAFDGKLLVYAGEWRLLKPGDKYLAQTKGEDPVLLTVRRTETRKRSTGLVEGRVFAKERKTRPYNLEECVRVFVEELPEAAKAKLEAGEAPQPKPKKHISQAPVKNAKPALPRPDPRDANQKINYSQVPKPGPR